MSTDLSSSDKNLQSFPKEIQEAFKFIKESEGKILFPRKYIGALEVTIWEKLNAALDMILKDILQDVLDRTPPKATAK